MDDAISMKTFYEMIIKEFGVADSFLKMSADDKIRFRKMRSMLEHAQVLYAAEKSKGNQIYQSSILGLNRNTVRLLNRKYGIDCAKIRESHEKGEKNIREEIYQIRVRT